jgi:flavorubredoxin
MSKTEPLKITDNVHWVGVNDNKIDLFEGLWEIPEGVSLNSYLIQGTEKTALIDSVHSMYAQEHLQKITQLIDPSHINYIILNHMEPDHTGALPQILQAAPNAQVILTPMALNILKHYYHAEPKTTLIRDDNVTINLGEKTLRFIHTPWLHWPETMTTHLIEENILFTCDTFGSFRRLPDSAIMETDIQNINDYIHSSKKYYAGVFSAQKEHILKATQKLQDMHIEPKILAPSHGPIYTINTKNIINTWTSWSKPDYARKVVVATGSMYGMTAKLVQAIIEGIKEANGQTITFDLSHQPHIDALTEVLDAPALMIGTPTYEHEIFPKVKQFTNLLELKKLTDRHVAVFGSYSWSGEATRKLTEQLAATGFKLVGKPVLVLGDPTQEDLEKAKTLAKNVAETAFSERGL